MANNAPEHHRVWALCHDGDAVGQVRAEWRDFAAAASGHPEPEPQTIAEISYWLGRDSWSKGFASAAVASTTARLFSEYSGLIEINARVMPGNEASCRVLMNAGYRPCGLVSGGRRDQVFRVFRESYAPIIG